MPSGSPIRSYQCPDTCIIYSGSFRIASDSKLQFISGTVFNQAVLWDVETETVITRFVGHLGVIFHVAVSDDRIVTCSDDRTVRVWDVNGEVLFTYFGHQHRVWRSDFMGDKLVSISEDRSVKMWKDGKCIGTWHSVSGVWSLLVRGDTVFAGYADGSIRSWREYSSKEEKNGNKVQAFVENNGKRVILSSQGSITLSEHSKERLIGQDPSYARALHLNFARNLIFLSYFSGDVIILPTEGGNPIAWHLGDSISFQATITLSDCIMTIFYLLNQRKLVCYRVNYDTSEKQLISIDLPGKFRVASAAFDESSGLLAIGSRYGSVAIFVLKDNRFELIETLSQIHDLDRVSSFNFESRQDAIILHTSGRNGTLRSYSISSDLKVTEIYQRRITKGWLERLVPSPLGLLMVGFYNNNAIVWLEEEEIFKEPCGGANRDWTVSVHNDMVSFSYIVKDQIVTVSRNIPSRVMKKGMSDSENRICRFLGKYVCFGGEDTIIRISDSTPGPALSLDPILLLGNHLSVVKSISILPISDHSVFLFSAGGRDELFAFKISTADLSSQFISQAPRYMYFIHCFYLF